MKCTGIFPPGSRTDYKIGFRPEKLNIIRHTVLLILRAAACDPARRDHYAGLILVSLALYACTHFKRNLAPALGILLAAMYVLFALDIPGLLARAQWPVLTSRGIFLDTSRILGAYAQVTRDRFSGDSFLRRPARRDDPNPAATNQWHGHPAAFLARPLCGITGGRGDRLARALPVL